jgi:hypothetical protein
VVSHTTDTTTRLYDKLSAAFNQVAILRTCVVEMASLRDHSAQAGACAEHTQDAQTFTCDVCTAMSLDSPTTPANRQAPQMNLAPGPKSGFLKSKVPDSPTQKVHGRVPVQVNNSAHESGDMIMNETTHIDDTPTMPWSDLYGREPPKTPIRKFASYRSENDCRTASPKKCPSVTRNRYEGRYHRVRSPLTFHTQSGSIRTRTKHATLVEGPLLNFNDVQENKERKRKVL